MFVVENDNYKELSIQLKEISSQIGQIKSIILDNYFYLIFFHLNGDKKWYDGIMGLNASNSKFGCLYCTFPLTKKWEDNDLKAVYPTNRTLAESKETVSKKFT